ncbi:MAG: hypothetical protein U0Q18_06225 [Bryobacteraceae bacterium]
MLRALLKIVPLAGLAAGLLLADFSYEQTSKITGGMLASVMKVAGAFSKQAREPIRSIVSVKGDRMAHGNDQQVQVIDLSKETITSINFQKKTYSVMTFAEMKQFLEQMSDKMKDKQNGEMHFKVSANSTGQTRQIGGAEAKEMVMKMEMEGTDQKSGQTGAMVITTHMWMAPKAAGYDEVRDFYRRMAEKLNWTPGANMLGMGRPDVAKGMAEVAKEMAKLDGMPVLQEVNMGAEGQPGSQGAAQGQQSQQPPPQQAQDSQQPTSVTSALGSALGGRFGLGRKKKKDDADQSANTGSGGSSGGPPPNAGTLLEMTTEMSNFSSGPVDPSRFEVPGGFKQVESDTRRMR